MCDLRTNNGVSSVFDDIDMGLKSMLDEPFHHQPFFGKSVYVPSTSDDSRRPGR